MRIEEYLNRGLGVCWLRDARVGRLVEDALLHFDGDRYRLYAWVVMPNHVHVVMTPRQDRSVSEIVFSWKSFTASRANALIGRRGAFWQPDYFDRFVRNDQHFATAVNYVEHNSVVASLCERPEEWPLSSARFRIGDGAARMAALPGGDERPGEIVEGSR